MTYKDLCRLKGEMDRHLVQHEWKDCLVSVAKERFRKHEGVWQWENYFGEWEAVSEFALAEVKQQLEP
jgi:hypothetical protein